jgi:DNA-binding beta-propeller fold protein YncE
LLRSTLVSRRRTKLVVLVTILALAFLALSGFFYWYKTTKKLTFSGVPAMSADTLAPPQFLFAFSGNGFNRMQRPVGVLADGGRVYVADSVRSRIFVYNENGDMTGSFGTSITVNPLYIAKNPKDSLLYVTDRTRRAVLKFTEDGKYRGEFDPHLPKAQLPKFRTGGVQWAPLAIAFGSDGTMYITEILNGHRLLIFSPEGKFVRSIGTAAMTTDPSKGPEAFQFPNGIAVIGNQVFVADSNNQRVKVYNLKGDFQSIIVTQGLPRGVVGLAPFLGEGSSAKYFVEVDTLSHDATIWTLAGKKVGNFGEQGTLDGQFSYPGGVALGPKNKIYVADTANGRVQVWGWPTEVAAIPAAAARFAPWCLLPLLLLPLLLLRRRREFFATADFVEEIVALGHQELLSAPRAKWVTTHDEYQTIKVLRGDGVDLAELFSAVEYSESDVRAAVEKYDLTQEQAITLVTAQRTYLACSESGEIRDLAKRVGLKMMNAQEYVERYGKKREAPSEPS